MGRPRLTDEQQRVSKERRLALMREYSRKRRQREFQYSPIETFDTFCEFQQLRILTMFHGRQQPRNEPNAIGPQDDVVIDGATMKEMLQGHQRYMRLGPALRSGETVEKGLLDVEVRK